jgi:hypothetical protein
MDKTQTTFDQMQKVVISNFATPKNNDIIKTAEIQSVWCEEFSYPNKDGSVDVTAKVIYQMKDGRKLKIGLLLHNDIVALRDEYKDKLGGIKVIVEGTGKATRYKALPQIK